MAKRQNNRSMAEDYISQVEWENIHPLDKRGRPQAKYQPHWKYKRIYPHVRKPPFLVRAVIAAIATAFFGFLIFFTVSAPHAGVGIVVIVICLSIMVLFYFLGRRLI